MADDDLRAHLSAWHAALADWMGGRAAKGEDPVATLEGSILGSSLGAGFQILMPRCAKRIDRPALLRGLAAEHGAFGADFAVRVDAVEVVDRIAGASGRETLVVVFDEHHDKDGAPYSSRRSTLVVDMTPEGCAWRHLHESWLWAPEVDHL